MGRREFVHRVDVVALFHLIELCGFVPSTKLLHRTDAVRDFDPSDIVTGLLDSLWCSSVGCCDFVTSDIAERHRILGMTLFNRILCTTLFHRTL